MANAWLEWYLQDGRYKLCRGFKDGDHEIALYLKGEDNKYHLAIQVLVENELEADILTEQLIRQYDKEKIFSKSTGMGKGKAFLNSRKRPKGN